MTTIPRLHERAQEAFHAALVTHERTGKWDPILADEYLLDDGDDNDLAEQLFGRAEALSAETALSPLEQEYLLFAGVVHPGESA